MVPDMCCEEEVVLADVGEGVRRRSGVAAEVGEEVSVTVAPF